MKRFVIACCLLAGSWAARANSHVAPNSSLISQDKVFFVSADGYAGSNFSSIDNLLNNRVAAYQSTSSTAVAYVNSRVEIGVDWNGFRLSAIDRQDWFGVLTGDTITAYQLSQTSAPVDASTNLPLQYQVSGFSAQGISVGHAIYWVPPNWKISVGISGAFLEGKSVKQQAAVGVATGLGAGGLNVTGSTVNTCTCIDPAENNFISKYLGQPPRGSGFSVDVGLTVRHESGAGFSWAIGDALSTISWRGVPAISLSGSSTFNGQFPGGRKWLVDFDQTLPVRHTWTISVPMGGTLLESSLTRFRNYNFPTVGFASSPAHEIQWSVRHETFFNSLQFSVGSKRWKASLQTDTADLGSARVMGFGLTWGQRF